MIAQPRGGTGGVSLDNAPVAEVHSFLFLFTLGTRHTLEPLAWRWSHWPGRLVNWGGKCSRVGARAASLWTTPVSSRYTLHSIYVHSTLY